MKYLCAEDEVTRHKWTTLFRVAQTGRQLVENFSQVGHLYLNLQTCNLYTLQLARFQSNLTSNDKILGDKFQLYNQVAYFNFKFLQQNLGS